MDESVRQRLRLAGKVAAEARALGVSLCKEGAPLLAIAETIEAHMRLHGAPPAFPTCLSIDHIAAHYSPVHDDRLTLKRGNVVKLDLGAQVDGYIADTAVSVEGGTRNWADLIKASEQGPETAIEVCRPKTPTRLIGAAVERAIESHRLKAVAHLGRLLRAGRIMTYESLVDVGRGIVAQTEHTMIVDGGGVEVTTR